MADLTKYIIQDFRYRGVKVITDICGYNHVLDGNTVTILDKEVKISSYTV